MSKLRTTKMLWGRAANRCSFPDCRIELLMDEFEADDASVIGDEAHIIARKKKGARGDGEIDTKKRNEYGNLILLCKNHHKMIDDQPEIYTVDKLKSIKKSHENWVKKNLGFDEEKQKDDDVYITYLERFEFLINIKGWDRWTSDIIQLSTPSMVIQQYKNLKQLRIYLLNRVWPNRYEELENAFNNARLIIDDFLMVFEKYVEPADGKTLVTRKFYIITSWDPVRYEKLLKKFEYHKYLLVDMLFELTRACNLIHKLVRKYLFSNYRLKEGSLLISSGTTIDMKYTTYRTEYNLSEGDPIPYKGLRHFMEHRKTRDVYFEEGINDDYQSIFR